MEAIKNFFICITEGTGLSLGYLRFHSIISALSGEIMKEKEKQEKRRENPIFTIWVHTGYAVLVLSVIGWMVYMEFFM